jgi:hypothetical protein
LVCKEIERKRKRKTTIKQSTMATFEEMDKLEAQARDKLGWSSQQIAKCSVLELRAAIDKFQTDMQSQEPTTPFIVLAQRFPAQKLNPTNNGPITNTDILNLLVHGYNAVSDERMSATTLEPILFPLQ